MTAMRSEAILQVRGVAKTFPGVRALHAVHLELHPGRARALLGENGAGKSTLINILSGVFPPDEGSMLVDGREIRFAKPLDAQRAGIGTVFQELNLIPHLSVAENIFLGREPRTRLGLIDYPRLYSEAATLLQRLDLRVDPRAPIADLRVGQQQLVEIARAISENPRVLILDEPTSSLSAHETEILFGVISDLKRRGVALIYITHKFEELGRVCDDVTVMRDGEVVGEAGFEELSRDAIVRLMAGREPQALFARTSRPPGAEAMRVEDLTLFADRVGHRLLVDRVSLSVHRGEVLGIYGLVGAGRTELLEALWGLHPRRTSGRVWVDGSAIRFESPMDAIAAGLALAPEDRKRDGMVPPMSVAANASLASLDCTLHAGFVSAARERRHLAPYLDRFRVKTPSLDEPIVNLSGGNQQKVILAKWLATSPKILLLDEPTRGIDVNAKREIYSFIDQLAAAGLAVIVVSSELPEVLALADRIVVLCAGRKAGEFTRATALPESVLAAALPDKHSA